MNHLDEAICKNLLEITFESPIETSISSKLRGFLNISLQDQMFSHKMTISG